MSMNLTKRCPHCGAAVGKLCKETCSANGRKISALKDALDDLGLDLTSVKVGGK